ncbi:alpha/beta hydrolase [Halosolutus gelatinilyticus]|uniref:alpha/beta hydrolase n=1 Tax=Halosolutus gelatinilyticus TaxID=2931975 RepID=UPI001FF1D8A5|nr:alpha/beta hydrolase [Halosolutus gelatinilyticus]
MTDVLVPGGRDVRGTLDGPADAETIVVACPPHPQQRGTRSDRRLTAVSDALADRGLACLRFDYGPWDEGHGERADARNAVRWAQDEGYDRVGLFGFSFGAGEALFAAADLEGAIAAVSVLAPPARLGDDDDLDVREALAALECPVQVCYGERDTTVDWEPIVERARERGDDVVALPGDHFFVGQHGRIAETIGDFLGRTLAPSA